MECLLQYLDELDDLYWLIAAMRERIRRATIATLGLAAVAVMAGLGVLAAAENPASALSVAAVLAYGLILRSTFGDPDFENA